MPTRFRTRPAQNAARIEQRQECSQKADLPRPMLGGMGRCGARKAGFTIAELLIVVAIVGVLVAIAIPVFNGALTKSKEAADVANVRATYAEWQTAILTENKTAPDSKDNFLKGPDNGTAIVLNYGDDKLAYDAGTGTITYSATKLTDENGAKTFTWTLGTPDIH